MHAESIPRMVQLVILASSKASDSLMCAESVPSMVRLVVLPSPKASPSLMRVKSVPSLVRLVVPQRCGCSRRIPKGCGCTLHLSYTLKTLYFFLSLQTAFFTLRMMRPSIFRMLRLLLLQDSARSVSTSLPECGWISGESTNSHVSPFFPMDAVSLSLEKTPQKRPRESPLCRRGDAFKGCNAYLPYSAWSQYRTPCYLCL